MKLKSMLQLLIPFGSTIVLFLSFWLLGFLTFFVAILMNDRTSDKFADFFRVNIIEFDNSNTVIFWIINIILIIIAEIWITSLEIPE